MKFGQTTLSWDFVVDQAVAEHNGKRYSLFCVFFLELLSLCLRIAGDFTDCGHIDTLPLT